MFFSPFSVDKIPSNKQSFDIKLEEAIELIKINRSIVAPKILEVLISSQITVNSFFNMSEKHYKKMRKSMLEEDGITLPEEYPPSEEAVTMIEEQLAGIIYENKYIYLSSHRTAAQIASTLVHEICHFLNDEIYSQEEKTSSSELFKYKDEVRAFTAEKIFERDGHCLRRSDMRAIHTRVTNSYSEFVVQDEDTQKLGYLYSCFDTPKR